MNFLKEKWINDGCRIEASDYEIEDRERLEDALCALDRTLDNFIKNRKWGNIMISLTGSRFLVSCENYESKVFINNGREYKEVTNELSEDDKTELIDDLIYAITDLMKN